MHELPTEVDVAVVGGGPAGLAAATALRARGIASVLVLDREPVAGGIPRHCGHFPFGVREFHRLLRGPDYAKRLVATALGAGVTICTAHTVTALQKGPRLTVASTEGVREISARLVLIATGVRETSRAARLIGGTKPGGVLSTGALQGLVYLQGMRPFRRPVIVGTELVSFSAILTCRHAGIRPVAMVEAGGRTTAPWPCPVLPRAKGIPLWLDTDLVRIEGGEQVEGVVLRQRDREMRVATDGVVVSGQFRPESALIRASHLNLDPLAGGPEVDEFGRCSDPDYFAAGNILRPVETAGWSWAEGRAVADAMVRALAGDLPEPVLQRIDVVGGALKYAMPQRVAGGAHAALPALQLRVTRPARGRLSLMVDGQEIAGRTISALPERRIKLPLPPATGAIEVRLTEDTV